MQRLRFFMDLSGNKDLLDRELVAFFASRKATPHDTQLALQWAESICQTDKVVISGFHSPLEMYWPQKVGLINKKIFIGKEFGIVPDSFRLILV